MKRNTITSKGFGILRFAMASFITLLSLSAFTNPAEAQVKNIVLVHGAFVGESRFDQPISDPHP